MVEHTFEERFTFSSYLGSGSFGAVVHVIDKDNNNEPRAMKLMEVINSTLEREILSLTINGHHENIIRFYRTWTVKTRKLDEEWQRELRMIAVSQQTGVPSRVLAIEMELCESE